MTTTRQKLATPSHNAILFRKAEASTYINSVNKGIEILKEESKTH